VHVPAELVKPGSGPVRPAEGVIAAPSNGHNGHNGHNGNATVRLLPAFSANPPSRPDLSPVPRPAEWGAFAGQAIGKTTAKLDPSGFTWFPNNGQPSAPPPVHHNGNGNGKVPADSAGQEPVTYTEVGLPRRVPKSHVVPSLVRPSGGRHGGPVRQRAEPSARTEAPGPAPQRNPSRARGFLDDYQAGIRQGQPDTAESASHGGTHGTGQGEAQ
jgi:hypothetical protein